MPKDLLSPDSDAYHQVLTALAKICYNNSNDLIKDLRCYYPESYRQLEKAVNTREQIDKKGILLASGRG